MAAVSVTFARSLELKVGKVMGGLGSTLAYAYPGCGEAGGLPD